MRTALLAWLYARRFGGKFVLRIEDTDRERSSDEAVASILEGLRWLGLDTDEGPYFQTERYERYRNVVSRFLSNGLAYRCYCTKTDLAQMRADQLARKENPRYDRRCRTHPVRRNGVEPTIRFANPEDGEVVVNDVVHGPIVFRNSELDDVILMRADGTPTYNFCVAVDDRDMRITHVIRGDDHISNTPRQINILRAMGGHVPVYAHVPMILGDDGTRLSKRHGAIGVLEYRREGYLPEALLNYLGRLGLSHTDQEIFSLDEMIANFDLLHVSRAAAALDVDKLEWMNLQHMLRADSTRLAAILAEQLRCLGIDPAGRELVAIVEAQRGRVKTVREMAERSALFFSPPATYDADAVAQHLAEDGLPLLAEVREQLGSLAAWDPIEIEAAVRHVATVRGLAFGAVAQSLRVAVAGGSVSPPIDQTLAILGRDEALARLQAAAAFLSKSAA